MSVMCVLSRYDEELVVPIIENTPEEMDLTVSHTGPACLPAR